MGAGESGRGSAPGDRGATVEQWAAKRERYVDNLKVLLIAVVIAGHALVGYAEFDWWSYSDVREVTLAPATTIVLIAVALPFALLVIPLLFLVSGLLTPPSVERKGPARFATDRLLRLGVPFAVFAILLWPLLEYALFRWLNEAPALGVYLRDEGSLDTGVLWFVGALLVFSLAYAGWVRMRRGRTHRPWPARIRGRHLAALAAAVTVATFLLRLVVPFETDNWLIDVNLWEWPASAALFGLGVVASREGWLHAVPDGLRRLCRTVTLVGVVAAGGFALAIIALGVDEEQLWGGWHWPAFVFAAGECTLSVFGPVWLLGVAQRGLDRPFRWARPAVSRSAYGAFMLQGIVLIGLALALRPVPFPAELKAILVAVAGVAGSYALAWLLISRVPGVGRVL